tara:strand:- start:365 stop:730 length:366 start_codon:yes stop_codon:yes gene_type:complete
VQNRQQKQKAIAQRRRRHRIRKRISGTAERPRLVVRRSLRNIEAQLVDDVAGHSIIGLSTLAKGFNKQIPRMQQGHELGKLIASKAKEQGVEKVVFDRAGLIYHGVIRAVAEGAREGGLQF